MAINSYQKNGETLWRVYVNIRSKEDPAIREQKVVLGIKTEKAAVAEEKKLLKELTKKISNRASQGSTWGAVLERWETEVRSDPIRYTYVKNTIDDYLSAVRRWTEFWFKRPASEINRGDARELFQRMDEAGKTRGHQKYVKNAINVIFTWGIENRIIRGVNESPVRGIQVSGAKKEKVPDILTLDEIRKLLASARELEHPWYSVWAMALLTGMRNGELHSLMWKDVDLENRKITVCRSYNTRTREIKSTKSGSWRTVPISDELFELLQALREKTGSEQFVLERHWKWDKGLQARELRKFCKGIGIPPIRFHALRACFATHLLAHDVAPARVMKICGWQDLKTMQHYVRLAGLEEDGATQVLKLLSSDGEAVSQVGQMFKPAS